MDPSSSALPTRIIQALLFLCLLMAGMTWTLSRPAPPASSESATIKGPIKIREALTVGVTRVLMDLALTEGDLEATPPLLLTTPRGQREIERLAIYLPPGSPTEAVVQAFKDIDIPSLTWRVHHGADLTWNLEARIEGIPTLLIELTPPFQPKGPDPTGAPYPVALMLSGLGESLGRFEPLLSTTQTMSLAIQPYAPFALEWGEEGLAAGKEIWVDLSPRGRALKLGRQGALKDALEAIPNAEGVYLPKHPSPEALERQGLFSLLKESRWGALIGGPRLMALAQVQGVRAALPLRLDLPGRGWSERELARLLAIAQRDGVAIGVIDASVTSPESVLYWLQGIERIGFEPIGVGEALSILAARGKGSKGLSQAQISP